MAIRTSQCEIPLLTNICKLFEYGGDILFHTLAGDIERVSLQEYRCTFKGNNCICKGTNGRQKPFIWKKREVNSSQIRKLICNIIKLAPDQSKIIFENFSIITILRLWQSINTIISCTFLCYSHCSYIRFG